MLMEFAAAPHERWAKLAKRMHGTEHAGDDTTPVGEPEQGGSQDETASIDDGVLVVSGRKAAPMRCAGHQARPAQPHGGPHYRGRRAGRQGRLNHDTVIASEWATPSMVENGLDPEDLLGRRFGHHLNFWSMSDRKLTQRVDLGDQHQMVFDVRPAGVRDQLAVRGLDDIFYPDGVGAWPAKLDADIDRGGIAPDPRFFPNGDDFRGLRVHQTRLQAGMPPATPTATPTDHDPAGAPPGEDSLVNLLLAGGGAFPLVVAIGLARVAAARDRLTRRNKGSRRRS